MSKRVYRDRETQLVRAFEIAWVVLEELPAETISDTRTDVNGWQDCYCID